MNRIKKWAKHNALINGLVGVYRDYFGDCREMLIFS